jgi:hypothetical protein
MVRVPGDTDDPDDIVGRSSSVAVLNRHPSWGDRRRVACLGRWVGLKCSLSNLRYFLVTRQELAIRYKVSFSCGTAFGWLSATAMPFSAVWKPLSRQR